MDGAGGDVDWLVREVVRRGGRAYCVQRGSRDCLRVMGEEMV